MPKSIGTKRSPAASYGEDVKENLAGLIYSISYPISSDKSKRINCWYLSTGGTLQLFPPSSWETPTLIQTSDPSCQLVVRSSR